VTVAISCKLAPASSSWRSASTISVRRQSIMLEGVNNELFPYEAVIIRRTSLKRNILLENEKCNDQTSDFVTLSVQHGCVNRLDWDSIVNKG
jgi:hypothetical protein